MHRRDSWRARHRVCVHQNLNLEYFPQKLRRQYLPRHAGRQVAALQEQQNSIRKLGSKVYVVCHYERRRSLLIATRANELKLL